MSREYTPYAIIETTFILSDPRYKSLPASASKLYIALWARAFQDRRETLPNWYDTAAMQEDSSLDARTVRKSVAILLQRCLISMTEDGRVNVNGVKGKGRVKWKDDGATKRRKTARSKTNSVHIEEKRREEKRDIPIELTGLQLYESDSVFCVRFADNFKAWEKAYPDVDVIAEIKKAHAWEVSNPSKMKTNRARFIGSWLSKGLNPTKKRLAPQPAREGLFNVSNY